MGTCCTDHVTPLYLQKLALTSPIGSGCSVGMVRVRTKANCSNNEIWEHNDFHRDILSFLLFDHRNKVMP